MRALASYLIGLFTLASLVATGGAWQPQSSQLTRVSLTAVDTAYFSPRLALPTTESVPLLQGCRPPTVGSICLADDYRTPPPPPPGPYDVVPSRVGSVEDWRPLVEMFFAPRDVDRALRIIRCESRGNPWAKNPGSSASGLFQHLASAWPSRSAKAGWAGSDIFDPVANTAVAAWLVYQGGGWSHWAASGHCW